MSLDPLEEHAPRFHTYAKLFRVVGSIINCFSALCKAGLLSTQDPLQPPQLHPFSLLWSNTAAFLFSSLTFWISFVD